MFGPKVYCLFSNLVSHMFPLHGFTYHIYVDDSQLYQVIKQDDDPGAVTSTIENCVCDVKKGMSTNMLKMNESNIEIIFISTCYKQNTAKNIPLKFDDNVIFRGTMVKNLRVFFDSHLSMELQVF